MPSLFFFPALIITLFKGQRRERIFLFLYLANMLPISFLAFVESRYLIPFYPLILIISVLGSINLTRVFSLLLEEYSDTEDNRRDGHEPSYEKNPG